MVPVSIGNVCHICINGGAGSLTRRLDEGLGIGIQNETSSRSLLLSTPVRRFVCWEPMTRFNTCEIGPRFAVLFLQYYLRCSVSPVLSKYLLVTGIVRTLSCGGWVFITSSDDHDWHDILMITYIVCNIPWMYGGVSATVDPSIHGKRYVTYFL